MTLINPPTQVSLLATDRANTVTRRSTAQGSKPLAYTAFGHRSPESEDAGGGFNGQYLESQGAYLLGNGYRAYRPALGRFNGPDSYSPFWGGGLNSYMYCRGEPVNRRDPSGHADDDGFTWAVMGLGFLSMFGGAGRAAMRRKITGVDAGLVLGGLLGAGTATMGLGSVDHGLKQGLAGGGLAAIAGGLAVGLGTRGRFKPQTALSFGNEIYFSQLQLPRVKSISEPRPPILIPRINPITTVGMPRPQPASLGVPPPLPPTPLAPVTGGNSDPQALLAGIMTGAQKLRPVGTTGIATSAVPRVSLPDLDSLSPAERFAAATLRAQNLSPGQLAGGQQGPSQRNQIIRKQ